MNRLARVPVRPAVGSPDFSGHSLAWVAGVDPAVDDPGELHRTEPVGAGQARPVVEGAGRETLHRELLGLRGAGAGPGRAVAEGRPTCLCRVSAISLSLVSNILA